VTAAEQAAWLAALAGAVAGAPEDLRALASAELHIGGFTNVQLEHPVLDLRAIDDAEASARALIFFLAAALLREARIARIHVASGSAGAALAKLARKHFRAALERVDDESVSLLRYFDLYLRPATDIEPAAGTRIARHVAGVLAQA
jgi:hypothetical protein